jgi:hypothetical protein
MNTNQIEANTTANNLKLKENLNHTQKTSNNPVNNSNGDQTTKKQLQQQNNQTQVLASNYPQNMHSNFNPSNLKQQQYGVAAFQVRFESFFFVQEHAH